MEKIINIKFVCPICNSDKLIEQVKYVYNYAFNEMVISKDWQADRFFCMDCANDVMPSCVDFGLREQNA